MERGTGYPPAHSCEKSARRGPATGSPRPERAVTVARVEAAPQLVDELLAVALDDRDRHGGGLAVAESEHHALSACNDRRGEVLDLGPPRLRASDPADEADPVTGGVEPYDVPAPTQHHGQDRDP